MIEAQQEKLPIVWTISASVAGGGSGIQADLLTFNDFSVHGCTVVTAINAQNSFAQGHCLATERKNVVAQINALDSDMQANVIKVGVLPNLEITETVAKYLKAFEGFVIYDPEFHTNGEKLLSEATGVLRDALLPEVDLLIVNIEEAESLLAKSHSHIDSPEAMEDAAVALINMGPSAVIVTGAHFDFADGKRFDYCLCEESSLWVTIDALVTSNNRGGGCILSAAIAAATASGESLESALTLAKSYVAQGIRGATMIGGGPGAVAHLGWPSDESDKPQTSAQRPTA